MNKQYVTEQLMEKVAFIPALALPFAAPAIGGAASWLGSTLGLAGAGAAIGGIANNVKDYFKPIQKGTPMPGKIHTSGGTPNLTKINPYTAYPAHQNTLQPNKINWTNPALSDVTKTFRPAIDNANPKATQGLNIKNSKPIPTNFNSDASSTTGYRQDPSSDLWVPNNMPKPEPPPESEKLSKRIWNKMVKFGKTVGITGVVAPTAWMVGKKSVDVVNNISRNHERYKLKNEPISEYSKYTYFTEQLGKDYDATKIGMSPDLRWRDHFPGFDSLQQLYNNNTLEKFTNGEYYKKYPDAQGGKKYRRMKNIEIEKEKDKKRFAPWRNPPYYY